MRARLGPLAALIATASVAHAQSTPSPHPRRSPAVAKAKPPDVPAPPEANVHLAVDAPSTRGTWTMRITNAGDIPVRIVADDRLLTLEVTPRGAHKAERCELPADMRPADDLDRAIALPPGRAYVENFEPRLYCFGAKLGVLAPGAIVVSHLGWPGRATTPPLELSPIDGVTPEVAPKKLLDAPPIALPDERTAPPTTAPAPSTEASGMIPRLSLTSAEAVDADSAYDITIPVTLRNEGSRRVVVRFRPEVLSFDVTGPAGTERCAWPKPTSAPTPELFTTIGAKSSASLNVLLTAYCTGHALDQAGLLSVRAWLDTRAASGQDAGRTTFSGVVGGAAPTLVRLHRGVAPEASVRPVLREP